MTSEKEKAARLTHENSNWAKFTKFLPINYLLQLSAELLYFRTEIFTYQLITLFQKFMYRSIMSKNLLKWDKIEGSRILVSR